VLKTDIQLQMLGVAFDRRMADLDAVKKHKAPYVEDEGEIIEDSTFIRWRFERKLERDLDAGLSEAERGQAWALERMLEDRLNMIMLAERWLEDRNFFKGPAQFFARVPEAMRAQVMEEVRTGMRAMMERHGILRHSRGERLQLAAKDIEAVARVVGDDELKLKRFPWAAIYALSPFVTMFREMIEMRYLWRRPLRLDNAKLVAFLGGEPRTELDAAIGATLAAMGCLDGSDPAVGMLATAA